MNIEQINLFIKFLGLNTCILYTYFKIINYKEINISKLIILFIINISLSIMQIILNNHTNILSRFILIYMLYTISLSIFTKYKFAFSIIITTLSIAFSYIFMTISSFLILFCTVFLTQYNYKSPLILLLISLMSFIINLLFFKIKRFKNGFTFIQNKNDYFEIFILITTVIIIFVYLLILMRKNLTFNFLTISLALFSLIMIFILQKTFTLFQKSKLMHQTIKDYEYQINELQNNLNTALEEKQKLTKTHHEFYHRQEALKQKLENLIKLNTTDFSTESAEEISNILNRIDNLSNEYSNNIKVLPKLPKTNIVELDDMFSYMQSECNKSNIEFILKLNDYIDYMVENLIPLNKLETLIGDLLRNAIIAINHSNNTFKNIMCIIGKSNKYYELSIYDSGINFNIETLLKLGLEPASTHLNDGGNRNWIFNYFRNIKFHKSKYYNK